MVSTKIGTEKITRPAGYLVYIGKDGHVWASPMAHNKTGKKHQLSTVPVTKKQGKFMYYLGKDGFVYEAEMNTAGRPKGAKAKAE